VLSKRFDLPFEKFKEKSSYVEAEAPKEGDFKENTQLLSGGLLVYITYP